MGLFQLVNYTVNNLYQNDESLYSTDVTFCSVSNGTQYVGMCVSGWVNRVADEIIEIID